MKVAVWGLVLLTRPVQPHSVKAKGQTMVPYTKRAKRDIYREVTDKILSALERGVVPWRCPWGRYRGLPANLSSGKAYRGANTILLAMARRCVGYDSPY